MAMAMAMAMDRSIIVLLGASRVCVLGSRCIRHTACNGFSREKMGVSVRALPPLMLDRLSHEGIVVVLIGDSRVEFSEVLVYRLWAFGFELLQSLGGGASNPFANVGGGGSSGEVYLLSLEVLMMNQSIIVPFGFMRIR
uniref:Uncharacterized protein n=1 Tax=Ananas comosus var. bracteatus TaxID=296719 RepID=A0A6V7PMQ5_ANACO|nr:unnamed protein product [Ananas comosus var. bracteatus]